MGLQGTFNMSMAKPPSPAEPPVLAYLFTLRRARHPMPKVWASYFDGCEPGSFRIHIHVDPSFNATELDEKGPAAKYFHRRNTLPREQLAKVRRFGHELVRARMKLLRYATSDGKAKSHLPPLFFSFFSEACAPISTCKAAHALLRTAAAATPPRSFIEDKRPMTADQRNDTPQWRAEFVKVCPGCAGVGLPAKDFRFSPGWVTLWWEHAKALLDTESKYDSVFASWGWSKLVNGIPDETYWSTLLLHKGLPITGTLTTYMEPGDPKTGHSKTFNEQNIPMLWEQPAPALFARKFLPTPRMDTALTARLKEATGKAGGAPKEAPKAARAIRRSLL